MAMRISLNVPQGDFLQLPQKYRAFVAGFGSGKTFVACNSICAHFYEFPRLTQGYFGPSYPHIRDIFYPTIEEVAHNFEMKVEINQGNKEVHFYRGRTYYGTTICRSMERPATIVGFKIAHAVADEIDILPKDKAALAWRKIIARMRYNEPNVRNGVDVTTTPEGFLFVHNQFVAELQRKPELRQMYGLVQASTYDNEANLPADYIPSLLASYPSALISAYLDGQFVNLKQGTVYTSFNRHSLLCITAEVEQPHEPLHIGMDFNVGKMAAIVHVIRKGRPYAVAEILNLIDTPAMIQAIKARFPSHHISIYPDASGDNRKSQKASETDIALLRAANFTVLNNPANPLIRDRVLSMNRAFEEGYRVNTDRCPTYTECLEQQAYDKNGEPDKSNGFDHPNDAGGYFIAYKFPIMHNRVARVRMKGQ
jgi:hypothetical protein